MHPSTRALPKRREALAAGAAAGALVLSPVLAWAQAAGGARKLSISYPTRSGASWPLWIAKNGGYFQKYGIDATLEFGVHPAGIAALVSGQAQMTNYGIEQVMAAVVRDPTLVMMASNLSRGHFALLAHKEIARTADLKGKRVGVGRLGDVLYVYTTDLMEKVGLQPRDVTWMPTGTDAAARANMLRSGQIDATLMVAPGSYRLEAEGFRLLDKVANHPDIFVSTVHVFKKSWVAENPDWPARIIMAKAEAIKRFYDDKAYAVETFRAYDPQEQASVARLYDEYRATQTLDRIPLLRREAVESAVRRMKDDVPAVANFDFKPVIDMSAVRKLIAEGWFRKLFGEGVKAEEDAKLKTAY